MVLRQVQVQVQDQDRKGRVSYQLQLHGMESEDTRRGSVSDVVVNVTFSMKMRFQTTAAQRKLLDYP